MTYLLDRSLEEREVYPDEVLSDLGVVLAEEELVEEADAVVLRSRGDVGSVGRDSPTTCSLVQYRSQWHKSLTTNLTDTDGLHHPTGGQRPLPMTFRFLDPGPK